MLANDNAEIRRLIDNYHKEILKYDKRDSRPFA